MSSMAQLGVHEANRALIERGGETWVSVQRSVLRFADIVIRGRLLLLILFVGPNFIGLETFQTVGKVDFFTFVFFLLHLRT
mmetsp:Transcript_49443/g.130249  ORF Transcript_49443/g.130249 Transcript_49443/m.130249 type:complete len:81 (-) Transcript_49443:264-506(-)